MGYRNSVPRQDDALSLRLLSYNLHRFVGMDGLADPERVVQVIRHIDADIIAVQELGWAQASDTGSTSAFDWLQDALDMPGVMATTFSDSRGPYGLAVFSRLPVLAQQERDLSVPGREPRKALEVTFNWHALPVQVIGVHLGLGAAERRRQMASIWNALSAQNSDGKAAQVLMGDFNEWRPWAAMLRQLRSAFGPAPRLSTFPARWPSLPLDRIWVRGCIQPTGVNTERSAEARVASDHLPLYSDIMLKPRSKE
ncbi:MAG: endonuclease/exonuclease/phosphatase family protein [Ketobacteraceae bacterium]|nr:endonuclease/exonuclease/phosphatase family protein [Ketobacteraceae bacterium]